jgi:hypothetical protein
VARNESGTVALVAPLAGCAVGTVAITVAAERFNIDKEKIAVAAIGIGAMMASQTTGLPRHIGMGVASAGIATAIAEVMAHWKAKLAPPDEPVTRDEMHKVVEARSMQDAQTIAALRAEVAQLKAQAKPNGTTAKPNGATSKPSAPLKRDAVPTVKKTFSFGALVTDEQGKKLDAILRHFDDHDQAKLIRIYESLPRPTVDQLLLMLQSMPVHEAVSYVRSNVLLKS